ncbi:hypothetical protein ABTY59_32280 [Streptomyces sp. NPDC096079]|uniref:hypothetical protein n=1 Tax=Streptomyces sp. NPDC096079 TaxID=3155820 RepID=UPI0033261049
MSTPLAELPVVSSSAELMDIAIKTFGPRMTPAADMGDLARPLRALLNETNGRSNRVQLGDRFDVVLTPRTTAAAALLDDIQQGCGPVIEDPLAGEFYWLVPPGSAERWEPHPRAVCFGAGHTLTLPPLRKTAPPGPYWYRRPYWYSTSMRDRLVPTARLRELLVLLETESAPPQPLPEQSSTS